jgi:rod shape-determining protein MreD
MIARIRVAAVLLVAILIQTTLVPDLRFRGIAPDLMLLVAICAGLAGGAELGGIVGFAAGLLTDLFLQTTPLGLSALTYCLIGFAVGAVRRGILREGRVIPPLIAFAASAAGVVLFVLLGSVVGQSQLTVLGPHRIGETAGVVAVMNGILALAVAPIVAWAAAGSAGSTRARAEGTALLK